MGTKNEDFENQLKAENGQKRSKHYGKLRWLQYVAACILDRVCRCKLPRVYGQHVQEV